MERGAKLAKAKVEARPIVTKKSRQVDTSTAPELKQRLAEALEQHAAISEILEVISASPSDVQPVLEAVAQRAARLCEAPFARVLLVDGDSLRSLAEYPLSRPAIAKLAARSRLTLASAASTGLRMSDNWGKVRAELVEIMQEKEYTSVAQMKGIMSQRSCPEPAAFERANYMKALQSFGWTATKE
jgi:hypothetical protein